jgi:putative ABC transport system substrate-binding protein
MRRREFITLLGAATIWPFAARAQQSVLPVIGILNVASPEGFANYVAAFRDGPKEIGYVEGQNVAIEYRWAEGHYVQLPEMAADLVRRQVSVIVANTPTNLAAKNATSTIPIVLTTGVDPNQMRLVSNLRRPGGKVTGVSQLNAQLGPKRLELAHELMPAATVIALLVTPATLHALRGCRKRCKVRPSLLDCTSMSCEPELTRTSKPRSPALPS